MATSEPRSSPPTEPSGKGRRRTPRRPRSIEVTCRGAGNAFYPGRSVDLSRGGAQVEFEPGRWLVPEGKEGLGVFTEVLRGHLPDGFEVSFGLGIVRARATIVRVIPAPQRAAGLRVGLRFDPELSADDARRLGLGISGDEESPAAVRASGPPATVGPGVEVRLAPTRAAQHPNAPPTVGRLVEVQAHGLTVEFGSPDETPLPAWAKKHGSEVRLRCVSGARVLWATLAQVSRTEVATNGNVRLVLLATELPPKSVRAGIATGS